MRKMSSGCVFLVALLVIFPRALLAATITGMVVDPGVAGVPDVKIDVQVSSSGDPVAIINDTTDLNGVFSFAVPDDDTYDIFLEAPVGVRLVSTILEGVSVTTGTSSLGQVQLLAGALIEGHVARLAGGAAVESVNLDVNDSGGDRVYTPGDTTDASGDFAVVVPMDTISINLIPLSADRLVSLRVSNLIVVADTNLGVISLEPGAVLSGQVVALVGGIPVADADTDVDRSSDGSRVETPSDNTDGSGFFSVIVPLTTVDLTIEPAKDDRLVGIVVPGINVAGDTDVGVIQLQAGALLSGRIVRSSGGTAVVGADLDVDDFLTGVKIPTAGDDSDSSGNFSVVVPIQLVNLTLEPLTVDRLVAAEILAIDVQGDTNLGDVSLDGGALLFGRVLRSSDSSPVVGADTDSADSFSGASVVTPGDDSNENGEFAVVVPLGTVEFSVEPALSERLVSFREAGIDIAGDTDLGSIMLNDGFMISGVVQDSQGVAPSVSAEAYFAASGDRVHIPQSNSGLDGSYSFILPAGTFDLKWSPPLGQGTARLIVEDFVVAGDVVFGPVLADSTMSVTIGAIGHVAGTGSNYRPVISLLNNTASRQRIQAIVQADVPSRGILRDIGPPINKGIPSTGTVVSGSARVRIPGSVNPNFLGIPIFIRIKILDQDTLALIDEDFVEFEIR